MTTPALLLLIACHAPSGAPPKTETDTDTDADTDADTDSDSDAEPVSLLANGSFEDGAAEDPWNESVLPDGWTGFGAGSRAWLDTTQGADPADEGARYVWLGGAPYAGIYQRASVRPGQRVTTSIAARSEDGRGEGTLKLEFHDAAVTKLETHALEFSGPEGWARVSTSAIAPENAATATIALVGAGDGVAFDNAMLVAEDVATPPLYRFDLDAPQQRFSGMGAQVWPHASDLDTLERGVLGLNLRYVRLEAAWEDPVAEDLAATAARLDALGVRVLSMVWAEPGGYATRGMLTDVDGFADWWAEHVVTLDGRGLRPWALELMNEPDSGGAWSTGIAPDDLADLVIATRTALDAAGYPEVGIVGPGVTALDYYHSGRDDVLAMDDAAVDALAVWSSHAWDDGSFCEGGAECLRDQYLDLGMAVATRDPGAERPVFVTEYATKETHFDGVDWGAPDTSPGINVTNSVGYAVRVFENTLALLDAGAGGLLLWQLMDEPTEIAKGKAWGLIDIDGNPKPVWTALETLLADLPVDGQILVPPETRGWPVVAAAVADAASVVLGLSNDSDEDAEVRVELAGCGGCTLTRATRFVATSLGDGLSVVSVGETESVPLPLEKGADTVGFVVTLPAWSTLSVVVARR